MNVWVYVRGSVFGCYVVESYTRAKDCCAVTGMRADAMWRVYLCTLQIAVLVGLVLLVQPLLLPKPKLTGDQGLISQSTVPIVTHYQKLLSGQ